MGISIEKFSTKICCFFSCNVARVFSPFENFLKNIYILLRNDTPILWREVSYRVIVKMVHWIHSIVDGLAPPQKSRRGKNSFIFPQTRFSLISPLTHSSGGGEPFLWVRLIRWRERESSQKCMIEKEKRRPERIKRLRSQKDYCPKRH